MSISRIIAIAAVATSMAAQAAPTLITSGANPALTGASLIDFESAAIGTFTSQTFSGVTFSAAPGSLYIESTYSGSYGASGRYLANRLTPDPMTISFGTAVSAFAFNWGAADQPWTMELFDTSSALIATLSVPAQSDPYVGVIGADGAGQSIGSVRMTSNSSYGYDYFLLDDFRFVNAQSNGVPEPGSLLLAALALGALGAASRRKSA